jgi:N-acetylmuramoyl-L-alanine amidase
MMKLHYVEIEKDTMKKIHAPILFFLLWLFALPVKADSLLSIDTREGGDGDIRLTIEMTGSPEFRAEMNEDNQKLEIIVNHKTLAMAQAFEVRVPVTSFARETIDSKLMKLSFGLNEPYAITQAFTLQKDNIYNLIIDLKARDNNFGGGKDHIFGTLVLNHNHHTETPFSMNKPVIMIDPGHGGYDPGAVNAQGLFEKDIVLSLSLKLAEILKAQDRYDVRLTRENDRFVPLDERVIMARDARADLFLSIHADSMRNDTTTGASVYTLAKTASDPKAAALAARENASGQGDIQASDNEIFTMLADIALRENSEKSKSFANLITQNFRKNKIPMVNDPHRSANFVVLRAFDTPSVLLETGFISNTDEAQKLQNPAYQMKIAQVIADALNQFFEQAN